MTDDLSIPPFLDRTGTPSEEEFAERAPPFSWRDHLKVHPAANLFPMMSEPELRELGEDIKANGLQSSIVLHKGKLLDGRNRLDAMELVGIKFEFGRAYLQIDSYDDSGTYSGAIYGKASTIHHIDGDPYAFVLSANLHRRHLTGEQKRELIAKVLKAKPEASNRTVAKQVNAHHTTVGTVRAEMESTGEISQLEKTTGADGKKRKKPTKKESSTSAERAEARCAAQWKAFTAEEGRTAASAEISIEDRRAQNAALDDIPSEEEAEESYQETLYDQTCLLLQDMTDRTRQKVFAHIREKYQQP